MIVGDNLSSANDWQTGQFWADLKNLFRRWGPPDEPYERAEFARTTAEGYPLEPFGGFAEIRNYPSGEYEFGFTGSAALTWRQGVKNVRRETVRNGDKGLLELDGNSGNLSFRVDDIDPANPFRGFYLRRAGGPAGDFSAAFVDYARPFGFLRFMDWLETNFPAVREWADRPTPEGQQGVPGKGVALEYCLRLAKLTGRPAWLNVPHTASPDYVARMAELVAAEGQGVRVYLEYSNEPWNTKFPAYAALKAEAAALNLPHPDEHGRLYQHVANRLAGAVLTFRAAGVKDVVGVLAGQAANENAWLLRQGLEFLSAKYGADRVKEVVGVLAFNNYFLYNAEFGDGSGPWFRDVFARSEAWTKTHRALADEFKVPAVACYEFGQHLEGADPKKYAANLSAEMGAAYSAALLAFAGSAGPGALCGAFGSPADWKDGANGYWGHSRRLGEVTPKLSAILTAAARNDDAPPPPPPPPGPTTVPPPPAPPAGKTVIRVAVGDNEVFYWSGAKAPVSIEVRELNPGES